MNILKLEFINPLLRFLYKSWNTTDKLIRKLILQRIRYSGISKLEIDDVQFKMYSKFDDGIVDSLYFKNDSYSELIEAKIFKELAKQSKVIIDIGANTGLYSIISRKVNQKAEVYAFEPYHINVKRLRKNLIINEIQDVIISENALGDSNKEIEFTVPEKEQICDVLSADFEFSNKFYRNWINYKTVKVPQITLDYFLTHKKIPNINLIKIDVENYETFVLKGALDSLKKYSPVILIEFFVDDKKIEFYEKHLKPLGYISYTILKEGIIRTETINQKSACRNFILSKNKSKEQFYPYSSMTELINAIAN